MEELVLKRTANITSSEALDEINSAYPDAEILSFRRVKEAGNDAEFFITRVRVAAIPDEADDVVLDSEDIVIEDKAHEDSEEDKMNKIIELLTEIKDELDGGAGEATAPELEDIEINDLNSKNPLEGDEDPLEGDEDKDLSPLPSPNQPVFGLADSVGRMGSLVVARDADVPEAVARVELMREFYPKYKISKIESHDNKFYATLHLSVTEKDEEVIEKAREVNTDTAASPARVKSPSEKTLVDKSNLPAQGRGKRKRKRNLGPGISPYVSDKPGPGQEYKIAPETNDYIKMLINNELAYGDEHGVLQGSINKIYTLLSRANLEYFDENFERAQIAAQAGVSMSELDDQSVLERARLAAALGVKLKYLDREKSNLISEKDAAKIGVSLDSLNTYEDFKKAQIAVKAGISIDEVDKKLAERGMEIKVPYTAPAEYQKRPVQRQKTNIPAGSGYFGISRIPPALQKAQIKFIAEDLSFNSLVDPRSKDANFFAVAEWGLNKNLVDSGRNPLNARNLAKNPSWSAQLDLGASGSEEMGPASGTQIIEDEAAGMGDNDILNMSFGEGSEEEQV